METGRTREHGGGANGQGGCGWPPGDRRQAPPPLPPPIPSSTSTTAGRGKSALNSNRFVPDVSSATSAMGTIDFCAFPSASPELSARRARTAVSPLPLHQAAAEVSRMAGGAPGAAGRGGFGGGGGCGAGGVALSTAPRKKVSWASFGGGGSPSAEDPQLQGGAGAGAGARAAAGADAPAPGAREAAQATTSASLMGLMQSRSVNGPPAAQKPREVPQELVEDVVVELDCEPCVRESDDDVTSQMGQLGMGEA